MKWYKKKKKTKINKCNCYTAVFGQVWGQCTITGNQSLVSAFPSGFSYSCNNNFTLEACPL